jgi:hypothetical protein
VAGAAVDLTLVDSRGAELDLGTPIDATPEQSGGRCYFAAEGISAEARANRDLLARVLGREGLVNYPTEWWHYSYGDRYWALATGAGAALYGPVLDGAAWLASIAASASDPGSWPSADNARGQDSGRGAERARERSDQWS